MQTQPLTIMRSKVWFRDDNLSRNFTHVFASFETGIISLYEDDVPFTPAFLVIFCNSQTKLLIQSAIQHMFRVINDYDCYSYSFEVSSKQELSYWSQILQYSSTWTSPRMASISQRFDTIQEIGKGAFGIVTESIDRTMSSRCAIKAVKTQEVSKNRLKYLLRELRALSNLSHHPNIISFTNIYQSETSISMVMDLKCSDLFKLLTSGNEYENLTNLDFLRIPYQILSALSFCHDSQVVHRDIKPSNILLDSRGNAFLSDFGLSRMVPHEILRRRFDRYQKQHHLQLLQQQQQQHGYVNHLAQELSEIPAHAPQSSYPLPDPKESELTPGTVPPPPETPAMTNYIETRWYRAPEVILSEGHYCMEQDVWAAACTIGEFLGRKPLFPGNSFVNQIERIISIFGKPEPFEMDFKIIEPALKFLDKIAPFYGTGLARSIFPTHRVSRNPTRSYAFQKLSIHEQTHLLDLMTRMLSFSPFSRISAKGALHHPLFDSHVFHLHMMDSESSFNPNAAALSMQSMASGVSSSSPSFPGLSSSVSRAGRSSLDSKLSASPTPSRMATSSHQPQTIFPRWSTDFDESFLAHIPPQSSLPLPIQNASTFYASFNAGLRSVQVDMTDIDARPTPWDIPELQTALSVEVQRIAEYCHRGSVYLLPTPFLQAHPRSGPGSNNMPVVSSPVLSSSPEATPRSLEHQSQLLPPILRPFAPPHSTSPGHSPRLLGSSRRSREDSDQHSDCGSTSTSIASEHDSASNDRLLFVPMKVNHLNALRRPIEKEEGSEFDDTSCARFPSSSLSTCSSSHSASTDTSIYSTSSTDSSSSSQSSRKKNSYSKKKAFFPPPQLVPILSSNNMLLTSQGSEKFLLPSSDDSSSLQSQPFHPSSLSTNNIQHYNNHHHHHKNNNSTNYSNNQNNQNNQNNHPQNVGLTSIFQPFSTQRFEQFTTLIRDGIFR